MTFKRFLSALFGQLSPPGHVRAAALLAASDAGVQPAWAHGKRDTLVQAIQRLRAELRKCGPAGQLIASQAEEFPQLYACVDLEAAALEFDMREVSRPPRRGARRLGHAGGPALALVPQSVLTTVLSKLELRPEGVVTLLARMPVSANARVPAAGLARVPTAAWGQAQLVFYLSDPTFAASDPLLRVASVASVPGPSGRAGKTAIAQDNCGGLGRPMPMGLDWAGDEQARGCSLPRVLPRWPRCWGHRRRTS